MQQTPTIHLEMLLLLKNAPRPPLGGVTPVVAPSVTILKIVQLTAMMQKLDLTHYNYIKNQYGNFYCHIDFT
jgi:hypothetical protein